MKGNKKHRIRSHRRDKTLMSSYFCVEKTITTSEPLTRIGWDKTINSLNSLVKIVKILFTVTPPVKA